MSDIQQLACPVSKLAIAGDHAGFSMKSLLAQHLVGLGFDVVDCGPADDNPCDFPDYAEKVANLVISGQVHRGVLVCGSGVGVSVAANKFPGIRASICHDTYSARQGVEHDDMNVLCIGARIVGQEVAKELLQAFLAAKYTPQPRHQQRVDKILAIEKRYMCGSEASLPK
ncbi:MAG: ribose 5-phosphate isomerase B [Planctomycetales bacterium]|nr:ribose 5-phosphate isomerase B [Planctomycetales bacterium]